MALKSGRVGIHPSQVDPITGMLLVSPSGASSLADLSDAQISDPAAGQTLIYNGEKWENEFSSISPTTLATLQDVSITDPADGDYLIYNSTEDKWINSGSAPGPVVPEGSTVTPTDDIQKWLACAGITDKTYTTLNEVLADSTTLLALISSNNASDYLVRSTTWASGLTADSTAMTDIGANDYCAETLLADSTWCNAICNSTYFESVLTTKVPTMTSNTTPSGECLYDSESYNRYAWYAFNGDWTKSAGVSGAINTYTMWASSKSFPSTEAFLGYDFGTSKKIFAVRYRSAGYGGSGNPVIYTFKVQYSDDNTTWSDNSIGTITPAVNFDAQIFPIVNANHRYWRIVPLTGLAGYSYCVSNLQFYGR